MRVRVAIVGGLTALALLGRAAAAQQAATGGGRDPRNPAPPVPWVARGVCPGEGCQFGPWLACTTLVARAAEGAMSRPAFTIRAGDSVTALTGNIHVEQAGVVTFTRVVRIASLDGPPDDPGRTFTPADTVYPLFYGAEGYGAWYFRGQEDGGVWFFSDESVGSSGPEGVVLVRPHRERWWVQVRNHRGEIGWVDASWRGPDGPPPFVGVTPHYEDYPLRCPRK
jgi:hypothetical protein